VGLDRVPQNRENDQIFSKIDKKEEKVLPAPRGRRRAIEYRRPLLYRFCGSKQHCFANTLLLLLSIMLQKMRAIVGCILPLLLLLPSCSLAQLQVIGAGFGRTGTDSLREALDILGYHSYHMTEIINKNLGDHVMMWRDHFRDGRPMSEIVDDLYVKPGYSAAVDFPTSAVWKELASIYPNAKIILTERESPQVWWESASKTILVPGNIFQFLNKVSPFFRNLNDMVQYMFMGTFRLEEPRGVTLDDQDAAIESYMRNSQEARTFDLERTLIFDVRQGWEPLCNFLEMDIPPSTIPFPKRNSRADFQKLLATITMALVLPPVLLLMTCIYLVRRYLGKKQKTETVDKKDD
jgi:hypothetical protein